MGEGKEKNVLMTAPAAKAGVAAAAAAAARERPLLNCLDFPSQRSGEGSGGERLLKQVLVKPFGQIDFLGEPRSSAGWS